jgi:ABC-type glycerol-3-phosphate transport system substrate-binding protein
MKHTKRIILICFLFVFLCAQANAQEDMLTIYIPQDDIMTCQSLEIGVQLMKKSYPNLPIQVEYLPGTNYDGEYTKRLTTELMAGGGPDIIVMSDMTFPDINKAVQSNLFADLSSFLLDDHEFDRSNYIIPALDSGVIGNSQIYIPIFLRKDI